jgi:PAS domain S-box-containing protein
VGLCVFDRDLRWVRLNEPIAEICGLPMEAHIGRTPRELPTEHGEQAEAALRKVLETGEPLVEYEIAGTTAAQPGVTRCWHAQLVPIKDADGRILGVSAAVLEITDRKNAEVALREANERLRDADRRKDEFLGMLSHELRNPLAPIRNALYILDHVEPGGAQARRAREVANRQVEHLTRLVDDLLDVTRIARGKIDLRRTDVDLASGAAHRRGPPCADAGSRAGPPTSAVPERAHHRERRRDPARAGPRNSSATRRSSRPRAAA